MRANERGRRVARGTAAVCAALMLVCGPGVGHPVALAGVVFSGTVSGNDQGFITGATVVIDGPVHTETKTDADGRFTITDVPSGRYQLKVAADGYLGMERPMDVGSASVSVDIQLLRLAGL